MKLWMAPSGLHVEPGKIEDAQTLARMHEKAFFRGWPAAEFAAYLADSATTPVYVACDARRKIAGFAILRLAADEAEVLTIVTDASFRKKGVAGAMMAAMFEDLLTQPVRNMFLEVENTNLAALALYRRAGFKQIGERKNYYPTPDGGRANALVLSRPLG